MRRVTLVWPATLPSGAKPSVLGGEDWWPELHLVRHCGNVEVMAESAAHRPTFPHSTSAERRAADCATEAQEHPNSTTRLNERAGVRVNPEASTAVEQVASPAVSPSPSTQGLAGSGVPVSRRARVEHMIQHGTPRDAALRYARLTQGWIERITT